MKAKNPLLLIDYYKATHSEQYPKGLTRLVSYYTPRMTRLNDDKQLVNFGLQYFCKEFLIKQFNEGFFNRDKGEVLAEYERYMKYTLKDENNLVKKIEELYDLGYLPLEIRALDEGEILPIQVPCICITNTHDDFAWLVNTIESLMSATLWNAQISASVGLWYRKIVNKWYNKTCEEDVVRNKALGDFSFRGQKSLDSATISSSAFLLSFMNSATVPTIDFLEEYYNANIEDENVVNGSVSWEHSTVCSNFSVDGDEVSSLKRALNEIYPNTSFSYVCDSYDYEKFINEIIPQCKNDILNHNGVFLVRGDSGDPVDIVVRTVQKLWDIFGGTINSKGYKVLDSHVKAIYGDSITVQRLEKIYELLEQLGFASCNAVLGVGSFSFQCVEEDEILKPFTRDTFGIAVKATYCEINGKPVNIFKNPKSDTQHFKKSQKGCCYVYRSLFNNIEYYDDLDYNMVTNDEDNLLTLVFKDSKMVKDVSVHDIRETLWKGKF